MFASHRHEEVITLPTSAGTAGEAHSDAHDSSTNKGRDDDVQTLRIRCVQELTPLDMLDLANGLCDATGHTVWTGARNLILALGMCDALRLWAKGTRGVELGCGSGVGGLCLAALGARVHLTDGNDSVCDLARVNANLNAGVCEVQARVSQLEWGSADVEIEGSSELDLVLACDVVYDVSVVKPLLTTVSALLRGSNGEFCRRA